MDVQSCVHTQDVNISRRDLISPKLWTLADLMIISKLEVKIKLDLKITWQNFWLRKIIFKVCRSKNTYKAVIYKNITLFTMFLKGMKINIYVITLLLPISLLAFFMFRVFLLEVRHSFLRNLFYIIANRWKL